MANLISFLAGLVFALGLALSGMTQPGKVIGFLDIGGAWDPSLALVMVAAVSIFAAAYRLAQARRAPVPVGLDRGAIDARLVAGALVFGVGWGLGGFCPGPAIVSAGAGTGGAVLFVLAMGGGMGLHRALDRREPAAECS
jgi:uncharacterized protein